MKSNSFSLLPFASGSLSSIIKISGRVSQCSGTMLLSYELRGHLTELQLHEPAETPMRKDGIWQDTCLEFFLAVSNSKQYWEVNMSPSGSWNAYSFEDYRAGMREELAIAELPFKTKRHPDAFLLEVEFGLESIVDGRQPLDLAVCAVVKRTDGQMDFWALTHCGPKPDFHLRESFALRLPQAREAVAIPSAADRGSLPA